MSNSYHYKVANPVFRYIISLDGQPIAAFLDCTLPTIAWEMQSVREGGLNTYVHQLPGYRKEMNVTLRNGVGLKDKMEKWYLDAMNESFKRKRITIELQNESGDKVAVWTVEECIPVSWTGPQLSSSSSAIAIQTFELACGALTHELPQSVPVAIPSSSSGSSGSLTSPVSIGSS